MFGDNVDSSGTSVLLVLLQLFFAPLGCLAFGMLTGEIFTELLRVVTRDRRAEVALGYLVFLFVGFSLGYLVQTAVPRARQSGGLWVWVVPCCILGWGVLDQSRAPGTVIGTYFVFSPGDEGLGVALVTWPAVATCLYAFGAVLASRPATTAVGKRVRHALQRCPLTKFCRTL
jgi:F0F1-type ATP synthase membrane subunit c/vacuolar-type H+-ATPase subunit K